STGRNLAIRFASRNGHAAVVRMLLQDERIDPSDENNEAIQMASSRGHFCIVRLLLQDGRTDPSTDSDWALRQAFDHGHDDVVRLLLQDERISHSPAAMVKHSNTGLIQHVDHSLSLPLTLE